MAAGIPVSRRVLLAGLPVALTAQAPAPAAGRSLTIGVGTPPTSVDPHFHNNGPNNSLTMQIFDRLVDRDARARPVPGLAESWRVVSDTEWEFRLRRGVTWHDGRDFTADDVVFTFARVPEVANSPGGFGGFLRQVARVEVADPHTLRIHTKQPHPLLPIDLTQISIIARHVNGTATEDYNSGRAAIGTGAYRLISYASGDRAVLARNEGWWGGAEPWATVNYRFLANDASRTAALLSGDVDLIDQIPTSDLAKLKRDPRVAVSEIASLRTMFMAPMHSPEGGSSAVTDNGGAPLTRNPFLDIRVRRALSMAINREALVERVMEGAAEPTGQWLPRGAFGYNPEVKPDSFDPDAAKRLLAEAGYPQGFRLTIATPNDRWPNDSRLSQAVAQMWTRIGVRTTVDSMPYAAFVPRRTRFEFPMQMAAWGSSTGEATNYLINITGTPNRQKLTGSNNMWRLSDPALDEMVARASATMDDAAREGLLRDAVAHYAETVPYIQLLQLTNTWAFRRGLRHDPRMDERTIAMGVRPDA
ncbi:ABC transporter substrate-binding protein [Roseomonas indoligenes]|uniref:ABC transporter substrate-binding protein n=1 Tax=Roseomonas indoligenes TaxID=2820811 RepID=A0A940S5Q4_9PROT|nr:ABC transporter substrate-binding protein [Pararoseomonas indoligenes]MBP0493259.1 ABC transporter substrate-binding protein [Pararoseomonas indoligenes]